MKSFAISMLFLVIMAGCGYLPASHYAKSVVGESVSTEVVISLEDPQNSVIIKDAVDAAVITKFRSALVPKGSSKTHLKIAVGSVAFSPLQYDINGYIVTYRTIVTMNILRTTEGKIRSYTTRGTYDFAIEPNAIITDQARFEAIDQGAQKGLDAFIAQLAAEGAKPNKDQ